VHQRVEFEVLVLATFLRLEAQQRRVDRHAALAEERVLVAQVLAARRSIAMQQRVGPQRVVVDMARAQPGERLGEELAVLHAPRDLAELEALHVLLVEEGEHVLRTALLRHVLPRTRVDGGRHRHDLQRARLGVRRELALLGSVGRVVGEVAGGGEVERVLERGGGVGRELDAVALGPEALLQRHGAGRDLQQHVGGALAGGGVGDDDLAAVGDVDDELAGDEGIAAFAVLEAVAVVEAEEVLAEQQRLLVGRGLGLLHFLAHQQQWGRGLQRARVLRDFVLAGGERQVEHGERRHHLEHTGGGFDQVRRRERLACGSGGEVDPEAVRGDDVGGRLFEAAMPPVVLDEQARRGDHAVELLRLLAAFGFGHEAELDVAAATDADRGVPLVAVEGALLRQLPRFRGAYNLRTVLRLLFLGVRRAILVAVAVAAGAATTAGCPRFRLGRGAGRSAWAEVVDACRSLAEAVEVDDPAVRADGDVGQHVRLQRGAQQQVDPLARHWPQLVRFAQRARDRGPVVTAKAPAQQHALDEVQLRERPRLKVAAQVVAEQPVVDERLVELVRQQRLHHRREELRVLVEQEQVQLVARVLVVELLLLRGFERRPVGDEAELRQLLVARQRQEQLQHLADRVERLDLHALRGVDRHRASGGDELDALLFALALLAVERLRQHARTRRGLGFRTHQLRAHGLFAVDHHDLHDPAGPEVLCRHAQHAVLVGCKVRQHRGALRQPVEVAERTEVQVRRLLPRTERISFDSNAVSCELPLVVSSHGCSSRLGRVSMLPANCRACRRSST